MTQEEKRILKRIKFYRRSPSECGLYYEIDVLAKLKKEMAKLHKDEVKPKKHFANQK